MKIENVFKGKNLKLAQKIIKIVNTLKSEWPMTVRQIYYRLVSAEIIDNNSAAYQIVSRNLTKLRINMFIPWHVIEDRTRILIRNQGYSNVDTYLKTYLKDLVSHYRRSLTLSQPTYIEVWIEKDALRNVFNRVLREYHVDLVVCRGQVSTSFLQDYVKRLNSHKNQNPVILYFGDFDPSGVVIPQSVEERLYNDYGLDVEVKRIALNLDQIEHYSLPSSPNAIKKSDNNYESFIKKYGDRAKAVELDALEPHILRELVEKALLDEIDMDEYNKQLKIQEKEKERIQDIEDDISIILKNYGFKI